MEILKDKQERLVEAFSQEHPFDGVKGPLPPDLRVHLPQG
jgi:hypothetical protein